MTDMYQKRLDKIAHKSRFRTLEVTEIWFGKPNAFASADKNLHVGNSLILIESHVNL